MIHNTRPHLLALAAAAAFAAPASATPGASSAYRTDPQQSRVEDATSKGINQVNMITCYMSAMRPDALVNQGNYLALVDEKKCDEAGRASADNAGSSSGGTNAPSFTTAAVNSTRASNNDPMRVKVWIDQAEADFAATIFVNVVANQAPSANNPYGDFRIDYCGRGPVTGCLMNGYLQASAEGVSYFEIENGGGGGGGGPQTKALRLTVSSTDTGAGLMSMNEGGVTRGFTFAYNADYFLRRTAGGTDQCFSRDASDAATGMSVWRYGLYDGETGAREERMSGFPVEYTGNGTTWHGHMGYYGLWLPPEAGASNGATLSRVQYTGSGPPVKTDFTLLKAEGRLTKYSKNTRTLASMDKIRLNTFVDNAASFFPGAQSFKQYELYWDQGTGAFKVTAVMDCSNGPCQTTSLQTEQTVQPSFFAPRGGLRGWSQSLGGELFIPLGMGSVDAASVQVAYRVQELVYPADMPATLHCMRDCPTGASLGAFFAEGSQAASPYAGASFNNWMPTADAGVVHYTMHAASATMRDGTDAPVVFADAQALATRPAYRNGVRSGRLFTDLEAARCPQDATRLCEFQVENMPTYYQWETGANNWNQFAGLKDGNGAVVPFDAPLAVNYTVPAGAQYGEYAGKTIVLQYGGFGQLWGIPGQCVSPQTNDPVSCDRPEARYVPAFVIPFDETLGRVQAGSRTLLVKWLEREIRFARKALNVCTTAGITLPTGLALPTAAGLADPSDPASPIYIGTKPTITAAPRVVHGEVKY
jgi:hypothetical protein